MDAARREELPVKFDTKELTCNFGILQLPLPKELLPACERLLAALSRGKTLRVEITQKNRKRSLTANAALWAMLQDLAVVLKTTAEELYIEMLRKYGFYEDIAVIPDAASHLNAIFRIVEPTGYVIYGNLGKMEVYRCWRGSSQYDSREFAHLLDMVIEEAKMQGIDFISDADKALLLDDWGGKHEWMGQAPPETVVDGALEQ